jgi:hypothetical protein
VFKKTKPERDRIWLSIYSQLLQELTNEPAETLSFFDERSRLRRQQKFAEYLAKYAGLGAREKSLNLLIGAFVTNETEASKRTLVRAAQGIAETLLEAGATLDSATEVLDDVSFTLTEYVQDEAAPEPAQFALSA